MYMSAIAGRSSLAAISIGLCPQLIQTLVLSAGWRNIQCCVLNSHECMRWILISTTFVLHVCTYMLLMYVCNLLSKYVCLYVCTRSVLDRSTVLGIRTGRCTYKCTCGVHKLRMYELSKVYVRTYVCTNLECVRMY